MSETVKWLAGANAVLGAWLVVAALFVFTEMPVGNFWNDVIVGAAILVFAGYNFTRADETDPGSVGAAAVVAVLGVWLIVAPFVFGTTGEAAFWNDVVVGVLVAVMGGYNAYAARRYEQPMATTPG